MRTSSLVVLFALTLTTAAQEPPLPPASLTPALVLDPGGPTAPVTAVAFSPDGSTLYVGGADKFVRRYALAGGKFVHDPAKFPPLRVPIGPGNAGSVAAVAVSPDGKWVAVAGRAPFRDEAGFTNTGAVVRSTVLTPEQRRDVGVVYLFDPANPAAGRVLRGTAGVVRAVAFAHPGPAGRPALVAAGLEWADGKEVGAVRAFDVETGNQLAARTDLPATPTFPGLAAWHVGKNLHVAVAWQNLGKATGELVLWDVAADTKRTFGDGSFNRPLALRLKPDGSPRDLWSGGVMNLGKVKTEHGLLTVRPADRPEAGQPVRFNPEGGRYFLPLLVAAGGDTVATLLELDPPAVKGIRDTELRLLAPDGTTRQRLALRGMARAPVLPALSVSPDGKWVAVGGFSDHRVEVYAVAGGKLTGPVVLPGAAGGYGAVAFLAGDRLWFGAATEEPGRGGQAFDFRQRTVGPPADARIDSPRGGGSVDWRQAPGAKEVTVPAAGRAFPLRDGETVNAVAYLPAGVPWAKGFAPVVAVAHTEQNAAVSLVTLYDVKTGRALRRLSGPVQPIRRLAISESRPLLTGVGDDPTVFVWSLKDLGTAEAAIEGVFVTNRNKAVVVDSVEADSPSRGKLAAGDVIEAVGGEDGKLKPVARAQDFRVEVFARPVGGNVRVQVRGKAAPVVLPVGRGVGQRTPLFTLWVAPAPNAGPREWVGWSPAGPYDASSPATEARIGWLMSTGDPARPTTFAGAGQYRKQYYRRGVLEQLVDKGELTAALAALPPRQPPLLLADLVPSVKAVGRRLVRDTAARLEVTLADPDEVMLLDQTVLRWRATGPDGKPGAWQQVPFPGRSAPIDLAKYNWQRGGHTFEVALHDAADSPAPAVQGSVAVTYVPAPPRLVAVRVAGNAVAAGAEVPSEANAVEVGADVEAGPGGVVAVTVTTSGPGGDKPQKLAAGAGKSFGPLTVKLNEGVTVVRVVAAAEKAGDLVAYESDVAEVRVRHTPKPPVVPPPGLRLSLATPHEPPSAVGGPLVVDESTVTLTAAITSPDGVAVLEWDASDGKGWVAGKLDPKGATATLAVGPLAPGTARKVQVRAKRKTSEFATDSLAVVFHPRAPAADFADLPQGVVGPDLVVRGTYTRAVAGVPFTGKVVVGGPRPGESREFAAVVTPGRDPTTGTWQAAVTLFPGANRLGLVFTNRWRTREVADGPEVAYRRPPAMQSIPPLTPTPAGTADVVARVVTDADLPPTRLTIDGRPVRTDAPRRLGAVFGLAWWEVRAADVSVKSGETIPAAVSVAAANADGESPAVKVGVVPPPPPPVPPPAIVLNLDRYGGGRQIHTTRQQFAFGVRVTSGVPLTRVEVKYGPPELGELVRPVAVAAGAAEVEATPELVLHEGVNRVRVMAGNAGGESYAEFSVSYTPPPVRVVIDRIEEAGADGKLAPLVVSPGGGPVAATEAFLRVRGRVLWVRDDDPVAADPSLEVVVTANQVVHLPVPCGTRIGTAKERSFSATVFLNAAETAVRAEVRTARKTAGLPLDGSAADLVVTCRKPLTRQRLHVLVIGVDTPRDEAAALAGRVVTAVGGTIPAGATRGSFTHPEFARAVLYQPLVTGTDRTDIVGLMQAVRGEIEQSAAREKPGWVNDVVVVYYQGRDLVGADGRRRLHTAQSLRYSAAAADNFAVRVEDLPPTPGVKLVVLNVLDPANPQQVADALTTEPPQLRYRWPNPAARSQLFTLFERAVAEQVTVGAVIDRVKVGVSKMTAEPAYHVPEVVRDRRIGLARP